MPSFHCLLGPTTSARGCEQNPRMSDDNIWTDTWDEGEDANNHVLTLVIRPDGTAQRSSAYHDHYSLLATIEDRFGLPRLGQAAKASPLRELLVSGSAR